MIDEKIIEFFNARSEQALVEIDKKYGKLCHSVSFKILNNRQDAEECVNDAYLGVWNKIPPEHPDSLRAYLCRIVRNISLKLYHRRTAAKRHSEYEVALEELEDCLPDSNTVEAEIETAELTQVIENFLDSLSKESCVIFMRRYWFSDSCREISERVGLTEKNVSVRLTRIRAQLRDYLTERGIYL